MSELNLHNLTDFVEKKLEGTDCFLVKAEINGKDVVVEIDSDSRVDMDFVASLNQAVEEEFSPDIDAFDLEVGSAGLTSPLRLPRQFVKNVGNDVEVITRDGKKLHGVLKEASTEGFTISCMEKVKKEGEKRPSLQETSHYFPYTDVKSVVYDLKF